MEEEEKERNSQRKWRRKPRGDCTEFQDTKIFRWLLTHYKMLM